MRRFVRVFSEVVYIFTLLVGIFLGSVLFVPIAFSAGPVNNQAGGVSLSIHDGRMDLALAGESMLHVLEVVARQTGISVFVEKTLLDTTRTIHFRNLTVEEGLKRIIGRESYAMVFSAKRDSYGHYPVKAVRVYPKGEADAGRYVRLRSSGFGQRSGEIVEYSREEVDAILAQNDEIFRSAVARRIEARKNHKVRGDTPGRRTPLQETIYRAKQARRLKELKADTLARRSVVEAQEYARIHRMISARERSEYEHHREEILRERRLREGQR